MMHKLLTEEVSFLLDSVGVYLKKACFLCFIFYFLYFLISSLLLFFDSFVFLGFL